MYFYLNRLKRKKNQRKVNKLQRLVVFAFDFVWALLNRKNPKEVEKIEYNEFYKKTCNEFLHLLAYTHFTTEVCVSVFYTGK
jgi:HSP90 family molecular chaperone